MFALRTLVPLAFVSFVAAQADASVGIKAIEAHFNQAQLVGSDRSKGFLLNSFEPSAVLSVAFPGSGAISPGQKFTKEQVAEWPTVTATPANSSVKWEGNYTLIMVDADVVGYDIKEKGTTRHWLLNGVTIGSDNTISNATANAVTPYAGPWPAAGSGPHRYTILLYQQPADFVSPADLVGGIVPIQLDDYVANSKLGPLVGGIYMQVEEGTASFSVASTQAVVSSTLASAQSTGSASASGSKPATSSGASASATGSGSGNGAAAVAFAPLATFFVALVSSTMLF
jgi:phosphatidylethanolamine-binding protein (PEBP) family uncharacterized protein